MSDSQMHTELPLNWQGEKILIYGALPAEKVLPCVLGQEGQHQLPIFH